MLAEPLHVLDGTPVSRIELIPPVHQGVYWMGLEHLGVVIGEEFDDFSRLLRAALTGQQFQSLDVDSVYVLFEDFTHVTFYRRSLLRRRRGRGRALRRFHARLWLGAATAGHRHRPEPLPLVMPLAEHAKRLRTAAEPFASNPEFPPGGPSQCMP